MLIFRIISEVISKLPTMGLYQVISRVGAGVDSIDVEGWRSLGVAVTNTPEAVADSTADLAIALALAASRRLVHCVDVVRGGDWSRRGALGVDLSGSVVGVVGMGNIGSKIAKRARGFDCKVGRGEMDL